MGFSKKLKYFLVHNLGFTNAAANQALIQKEIQINGKLVQGNVQIEPEDEIWWKGECIKKAQDFKYFNFYKPRGVESTLNPSVPDNLLRFLPDTDYFPIGRLDKESEGLMIFTNNGSLYDRILRHEHQIQKEYEVEVNKEIDKVFLDQMECGVQIMGRLTLPCKTVSLSMYSFKIVLVQGLNRQIRRMCYKLGYEVHTLKRIRIANVDVDNLQPGESIEIEKPVLD
jgi:23S rRNA pseudouridine2604 synthase